MSGYRYEKGITRQTKTIFGDTIGLKGRQDVPDAAAPGMGKARSPIEIGVGV
jgi:hypothetical protein